jgi:hypothetical protein
VAYLDTEGSGLGWSGPGLEALPRGAATGLAVTSHDALGRVFHGSGPGELTVWPSRFDLMRLKPGAEGAEGLEARRGAVRPGQLGGGQGGVGAGAGGSKVVPREVCDHEEKRSVVPACTTVS